MYSFESRVRFSEVDQNGTLMLSRLVDYFQDCCIFHSEDVGLGMSNAENKNKVWMLLGWQIEIDRLPKYTERIKTITWPYSFVRIKGGRNFLMEDAEGNVIAKADSQWVYMNLETGLPERIPGDMGDQFGVEAPMELSLDKKKIRIPEDCEKKEEIVVRREHLDTNHHVNNGQYIVMAEDLLPEEMKIRKIKVEYRSQAKLGDVIVPKMKALEEGYLVALCDRQDQPYAVLEFYE